MARCGSCTADCVAGSINSFFVTTLPQLLSIKKQPIYPTISYRPGIRFIPMHRFRPGQRVRKRLVKGIGKAAFLWDQNSCALQLPVPQAVEGFVCLFEGE